MQDEHVYFFIRVMKTGSTSFTHYLHQVLGRERVYPQPADKGTPLVASRLDLLREAHRARGDRLRGYAGHFPAFAADIVGATRTITLLRHPVERTISLLRQRAAVEGGGRGLEEIYDDEGSFRSLVCDHQTKVFALTEGDRPETIMHRLDIDRKRFDAAREQLGRLDVVGLQEEFGGAVDAVRERWGWPAPENRRWWMRGDDGVAVPAGLRRRIAEDNVWDMELYAWAVENVATRGAPNRPAEGARREKEIRWTRRLLASLARLEREADTAAPAGEGRPS